jgi:hypothetical protein
MIRQMLNRDTQQIETCNGCPNNCEYCYEEQKLTVFEIPEIVKNYVYILDMNFLYQPDPIGKIMELGSKRVNGKVVYYELVCGLDYRKLTREIANELKLNRFVNPRIAWDWEIERQYKIKDALDMLKKAGYNPKEISVFILYNWKITYKDCLKKLDLLKVWGVKVNDCRFDNQSGRSFTSIYWTMEELKDFRAKCRKHNQLVLFGIDPEIRKELLNRKEGKG